MINLSTFLTEGQSPAKARGTYQGRRDRLRKSLNGPALIFSVDQGPGVPNSWVHLKAFAYQDPLFLYLTGIVQYPAAVLILPDSDILFLPPFDAHKAFWEGEMLGTGDTESLNKAQKITGFSQILPLERLTETLKSSCPDQKLGLFWQESKTGKILKDSHFIQNEGIKSDLCGFTFFQIADTCWAQKLTFDQQEVKNLKKANEITQSAFEKACKSLPLAKTEYELAGILDGEIQSQTPFGNSFPTILAGGKNATCLHYTANTAPLKFGDLVLIDFGAKWHTQHADVSRTLPINGKFDPMQAILYQIVLDTQKTVEKAVCPGVTFDILNELCWSKMAQLLQTRFLKKGGKMKRPYTKQPHNVGHLLGRQVHDGDAFRDYRSTPLQSGWVITNEPGLYGHFSISIDGKKYDQTIGIRIEDDLLITESGCQNLTKCPKSINELEKLIYPLN
jgi:Xaa-Pro aminopeptidase